MTERNKKHQLLSSMKKVTLVLEVSNPTVIKRLMDQLETIGRPYMKDGRKPINLSCSKPGQSSTKYRILTIEGPFPALEKARQLIRNHVPVEFLVSCRADLVDMLGQQMLYAHFWNTYAVYLTFTLIAEDCSYEVRLRGHGDYVDRLKEAVQFFCRTMQTPAESVEIQIETSREHLEIVAHHTELISRVSGARIRCLRDAEGQKHVILIRGRMDAAYEASDLIPGLTPLHMKFLAKKSQLDDRIKKLAEENCISIKFTPMNTNEVEVMFSSCEWNLCQLNELRLLCLGLRKGRVTVPKIPESWDHLMEGQMSLGQFIQCVELGDRDLTVPLELPQNFSEMEVHSPASTATDVMIGDVQSQPGSPTSGSTTSEDVLAKLLARLQLSHLSVLFQEKGIDAQRLASLTEEDLIELGISSKQARKTMLTAIMDMS